MINDNYHQPIMVDEVIDNLHINNKYLVIDATVGTGGHTKELIKNGAEVLGIEADPKMYGIAIRRVPSADLVLGNFSEIEEIVKKNNINQVDGILFDLGVSNLHLKDDNRGFSFADPDQILDMRLNPKTQGVRACDLLNALNKTQLFELFLVTMKYSEAKKIAKKVLEKRPVNTVGDLKEIAHGIVHKKRLDSATLPMLALRIAVNRELVNLENVLPKAYRLLKIGGRLLIITFHSKEEEIVKNFFNKPKVVFPKAEEIQNNPSARSAKLWIIEKK